MDEAKTVIAAKDVVKARKKYPVHLGHSAQCEAGIWQKVMERGGEQRRRCHVRHRFKENVAMVQIADTQERWSSE